MWIPLLPHSFRVPSSILSLAYCLCGDSVLVLHVYMGFHRVSTSQKHANKWKIGLRLDCP